MHNFASKLREQDLNFEKFNAKSWQLDVKTAGIRSKTRVISIWKRNKAADRQQRVSKVCTSSPLENDFKLGQNL